MNMTDLNVTTATNSSVEYEENSSFTGRVVLIFYCLIFIFGVLGISCF